MSDPHKWTHEEIEAFAVVQGKLPTNCTCGKDRETMAVFHAPGCKYRAWYVESKRASDQEQP